MGITEYIASLDPTSFEKFIADEFLPKLGFKNIKWVGGSGDRGVDILAWKEELDGIHKYAIQIKRYTSTKIGEKTVRDLYTSMKLQDCDKGIIITTSDFTVDATEVASKLNILLINGFQLAKLIQQNQVRVPMVSPTKISEDSQIIENEKEDIKEIKVNEGVYLDIDIENVINKAENLVGKYGNYKIKRTEAILKRLYVFQVKIGYNLQNDRRRKVLSSQIALDGAGEDVSELLETPMQRTIMASEVKYEKLNIEYPKIANLAVELLKRRLPNYSQIIDISKELKKKAWFLDTYNIIFQVELTEAIVSINRNKLNVSFKPIDNDKLEKLALMEIKRETELKNSPKISRNKDGYIIDYQDDKVEIQIELNEVGKIIRKNVRITKDYAIKLAQSKINGNIVKVEGNYDVFLSGDYLYKCHVDSSSKNVSCNKIGISLISAQKIALENFINSMFSKPMKTEYELRDSWIILESGVTGSVKYEISLDGTIKSLNKDINENYVKIFIANHGYNLQSIKNQDKKIFAFAYDSNFNYEFAWKTSGELIYQKSKVNDSYAIKIAYSAFNMQGNCKENLMREKESVNVDLMCNNMHYLTKISDSGKILSLKKVPDIASIKMNNIIFIGYKEDGITIKTDNGNKFEYIMLNYEGSIIRKDECNKGILNKLKCLKLDSEYKPKTKNPLELL
ncbi:restriction endonuclease [Acidianus brierleyi]|uniref:Restriction endonuclease type IV Mrr domain-containing protein n=1 Tax=Acidianus brierleyi TaxID=41673 RepID=A0A2U9ID79_9CREN|nr:restriction endonuclease [Acidianus brierleyi]AWR93988.1 hypothetical protein DFR85_04480 [Acidianus brierleyi]